MFRKCNVLVSTGLLIIALSAGFPGVCAFAQDNVNYAKQLEGVFEDVAAKVFPAVVSISTIHTEKVSKRYMGPFEGNEMFRQFFKDFFGDVPEREFQQKGLGSGFIIGPEGYILTNQHVVDGADKIEVTLSDGRKFPANLKGQDVRADLAVLKIDAKDTPFLELGDSDKIKIGRWTIAAGNPFGIASTPTITVGVVSALNRQLPRTSWRDRDYSDLIQTDAAINPGNSGGPLVDIDGKVMGINVAIMSTTGGYQGIGFAIPINTAKYILNDLIEGKKVLYGWLGVNIQDLNEDLSKQFGLTQTTGVLVAKVQPGTPAEKAKMKSGDIIKTFDGKNVENVRELLKLVGRAAIGGRVKIGVLREKKDVVLDVEIAARPEEMQELEKTTLGSWRGIEVQDITPEIAQRYKILEDSGVVIANVELSSPADLAGLIQGDIIIEINKVPIKNTNDYNKVISSAKGDALVLTSRGYMVVKDETEEEKGKREHH